MKTWKQTCLLVALSVFSIPLFAQQNADAPTKRTRLKAQTWLKIQGGLLLDTEQDTYFGPRYFALGLSKEKGNKRIGLELDFLHFDLDERYAIDLQAFQTYRLVQHKGLSVFAGPTVGLGYAYDNSRSPDISTFPISNRDLRLGLGGRLDVQFPLSQKVHFILGTKLTLIDLIYNRSRIQNPLLPIRQQKENDFEVDLPRQQFLLQMGFNFQINEKLVRKKRKKRKKK